MAPGLWIKLEILFWGSWVVTVGKITRISMKYVCSLTFWSLFNLPVFVFHIVHCMICINPFSLFNYMCICIFYHLFMIHWPCNDCSCTCDSLQFFWKIFFSTFIYLSNDFLQMLHICNSPKKLVNKTRWAIWSCFSLMNWMSRR